MSRDVDDMIEDERLRCQFAMAVLTGLCAGQSPHAAHDICRGVGGSSAIVKASFMIADEMMKAR